MFSSIDLCSAYHQVPPIQEEQAYITFEASGGLYQFTRVPFGATNGVACFQHEMTDFVRKEGLTGVFPCLNNITICGKNQQEHDANLECFLKAAKRKNMTYNEEKSTYQQGALLFLEILWRREKCVGVLNV